jgi:2Fe-2S ferredoxin
VPKNLALPPNSTRFSGGNYTGGRTTKSKMELSIAMPSVTYISATGIAQNIEVPSGTSVMQGALNRRVPGILGECGGNCMCATCHVYVDAAFLSRLPPAKENEKFMLSIAAEGPAANSRLSCQIKMTDELDGLIVRLPGKQK